MTATNLSATLNSAHLSPAARGVIATPASAAGTTAPIVSLYDLDTSSYDIDPDGRTVRIYGAAFFRTAPQIGVRFTLVLSRADLRDDEAPAWIDFDSDDLEAAGLALAEETAEAALLDALRTPGFNVAGAPAVLTTSLIDFYLPAVRDGAGRIEKLSGSILKELTGAATVAAAMDAIRNDMTGREDFAEICFSYLEACVIARARKERSE